MLVIFSPPFGLEFKHLGDNNTHDVVVEAFVCAGAQDTTFAVNARGVDALETWHHFMSEV